MNEPPLISIIITTYNALDYLKLCVESLKIASTRKNQIVIYADGSSVATKEYLESLRGCDFIKTRYESENVGIERATNRAAGLADGKYLYFINDDMVFAPGFDDALLRHLQPGRVLTGTMIEPEKPGFKVGSVHLKRDFGMRHTDFDMQRFFSEAPALAEERTEPGIGSPWLMERELYFRIGAIDERFSGPVHDPDLFYRIALTGAEMLRVRSSLCYHFSGKSLRFDGEGFQVSERWLVGEMKGKIAFMQKWGEKPRMLPNGLPQPGHQAPDQKWPLFLRLKIALYAARIRWRTRRKLKKLKRRSVTS